MRLLKHATATVFLITVVSAALAPQATAVPMPWETSRTPGTVTHDAGSAASSDSGTATVLCVGGCYQ
ncbi:hypothetical protein [Streptomyces sp. B1I3]|uniref:hypothetical protein n=1 Tax=Streptomyces sp. B1I3 TaxID=3042264 RepID=UPI0027846070|nr:hypothetical protein [Streptomyces sp. B1I3]MDQ0791596.1 hypothetical protein [Streptomyces sp. B1I3]